MEAYWCSGLLVGRSEHDCDERGTDVCEFCLLGNCFATVWYLNALSLPGDNTSHGKIDNVAGSRWDRTDRYRAGRLPGDLGVVVR